MYKWEKNRYYSHKNVTTQIVLYFIQYQGESAEFIGINEHFQRRLVGKMQAE